MITKGKIGLRAVEESDLEILKNWRNHQNFRKNFREFRELNSKNQLLWFDKISKSINDFMFSIVELDSNELIGACGLLYIDWINRSADFSFYIGKDFLYIDEKYSIDAAKCLLKYGFETLNLNKIWMELYEFDNEKLNFFKEKLGFITDGKLRENCFSDGRYWDSYILSFTLSDYLKSEK